MPLLSTEGMKPRRLTISHNACTVCAKSSGFNLRISILILSGPWDLLERLFSIAVNALSAKVGVTWNV